MGCSGCTGLQSTDEGHSVHSVCAHKITLLPPDGLKRKIKISNSSSVFFHNSADLKKKFY